MSWEEYKETWPGVLDDRGDLKLKVGQLYKFKNMDYQQGGIFYKGPTDITKSYEEREGFIIENGSIVVPTRIQDNKQNFITWFLIDGEHYNLFFSKEFCISWGFRFKEVKC